MNEDIIVIDNFIPKPYQDALETMVSDELFEWGYTPDVVWERHALRRAFQDSLKQNNDGFTQIIKVPRFEGKNWDAVHPMMFYLEQAVGQPLKEVMRVRANLLLRAYPGDLMWNNEHVDATHPHWTAIYYVKDSDGPTYIFDQRVTDIQHKNKTQEVVLKYVNETEFTVANSVQPKKGRVVIFDGQRFHASSKPKEHQNRVVIAFNWH